MFEKLKLGSPTTHWCWKVIHDLAILGTYGHCVGWFCSVNVHVGF